MFNPQPNWHKISKNMFHATSKAGLKVKKSYIKLFECGFQQSFLAQLVVSFADGLNDLQHEFLI